MENAELKGRFEEVYPKLQNLFSWTVDKRILLSMAGAYALADRPFDGRRLMEISDELKRRSGWFSPVRGQIHPMLATLLDNQEGTAESVVDDLMENQEMLRGLGFRNTIHSYLAAILLPNGGPEARKRAVAGKLLYDEMKRRHRFLTSDDDYAFAVLLGEEGGSPEKLADVMKEYYSELRSLGFRAGNELQWMSQTLTYGNASFDRKRAEAAADLRERFKKAGVKLKPLHYPMLGFLAAFHVEQSAVDRIVGVTRALSDMKLFRWYREMAFSFGIQAVLKEAAGADNAVDIGMAASIEQILRAQQAAMAAGVAASAAAASSSGNGGS
ncbi:DUF4003 family protein [Bhargavaea ullalensis]|uniref:DUF4003 domain-containing protein n=1 Tax=Bhargavaea ullalensis TaxID=1265685 RepID=A0ABV2G772_9BACL